MEFSGSSTGGGGADINWNSPTRNVYQTRWNNLFRVCYLHQPCYKMKQLILVPDHRNSSRLVNVRFFTSFEILNR